MEPAIHNHRGSYVNAESLKEAEARIAELTAEVERLQAELAATKEPASPPAAA